MKKTKTMIHGDFNFKHTLDESTRSALLKWLWCMIAHQKYRKRTGKRYWQQVSITYQIHCEKCGVYDDQREWIL